MDGNGAVGSIDLTTVTDGFISVFGPAFGDDIFLQRFKVLGSVGTQGNDHIAAPDNEPWVANGGRGRDDMTGGIAADVILGGKGNDILRGGGGNDRLSGGEGNDTLYSGGGERVVVRGDAGDDRLVAASGFTAMFGGVEADTFAFADTVTHDAQGTLDARIADFARSEGDRIDLSPIAAFYNGGPSAAFHFIGENAFSGTAGELRFAVVDGMTYIYGDTNGDAAAELVIRIDNAPVLVAGDFIL